METIDVLCFVFPDGSTFFAPTAAADNDYAHRVMDAWKAQLSPERLQRYTEANTMGGFVWMHMLREDYERLPATSLSHAITSTVGVA